MNSVAKKRKVDSECRVFNEKWTNDYFFVESKNLLACLICSQTVSVRKEFNVKRHYQTQHASKFDPIQGQLRLDKIESLRKALTGQQTFFVKANREVVFIHSFIQSIYIAPLQEATQKRSRPSHD